MVMERLILVCGCLEYNENIETQNGKVKIGQLTESINLLFNNQDVIKNLAESDSKEVALWNL